MNDLYETVVAMREAQKQYFKTRDSYWLNESKKLERAVDVLIEKQRTGQKDLLC